ncbi:MAG TPA: hypothetical protein PLF40_31650 [Kofleriaceae bacterium]|nr:hypothetical protein [Kofleriaceae bacterium]
MQGYTPPRSTFTRFAAAAVALLALTASPQPARADSHPPGWPVRGSIAMPFGDTWGSDRQHGFTWGFRAQLQGFPWEHGPAFGGYAELLLDAQTRGSTALGISASAPIMRIKDALDWHVGAYGGFRWQNGESRRVNLGIGTSLNLPFYFYQVGLGIRLDGSLRGSELSAVALLVDVDVLPLLALFGYAVGRK